jgi:hypothetical protein
MLYEIFVENDPQIIHSIYDDHIYQERSVGAGVKGHLEVIDDPL